MSKNSYIYILDDDLNTVNKTSSFCKRYRRRDSGNKALNRKDWHFPQNPQTVWGLTWTAGTPGQVLACPAPSHQTHKSSAKEQHKAVAIHYNIKKSASTETSV